MKYIVRQKIWSFKDKFIIRDEFENDRYMVESKIFTLGNQLHLYDMHGNSLLFIKQKLFRLLPEYEIYSGDQLFAILKKKLSFFKAKIDIDQNGTAYNIAGDIWAHEFTVSCGGTVVATVSKTWFTWSDTYGVDVSAGENDAWILALVICIDQILYDKKG